MEETKQKKIWDNERQREGKFSFWRKEPPVAASAGHCITWGQTVHAMKIINNADRSRTESGRLISRRQIEVDWQVNWTWRLHMIFYCEKKQRIEMNLRRK